LARHFRLFLAGAGETLLEAIPGAAESVLYGLEVVALPPRISGRLGQVALDHRPEILELIAETAVLVRWQTAARRGQRIGDRGRWGLPCGWSVERPSESLAWWSGIGWPHRSLACRGGFVRPHRSLA